MSMYQHIISTVKFLNVDFEIDLVFITEGSTSTAMNFIREKLAKQM